MKIAKDSTKRHQPTTHCILVAEDNPMNQKVAMRQLDKLGYTCMIANNGLEVLKLLDSNNQFSLILMDCQMPECSGYTCTQEIRKREKETGHHIPIVAVTANAMTDCETNCFQAGMDDYIPKPVKLETLHNVLKKWIPRSE